MAGDGAYEEMLASGGEGDPPRRDGGDGEGVGPVARVEIRLRHFSHVVRSIVEVEDCMKRSEHHYFGPKN